MGWQKQQQQQTSLFRAANDTGTLNFLRGTQPYYLFLVETSVNGTTDTYSTTISCN
ncbi:MAG: hypothetical protein KGO82_16240 [Bacteroidota bacterium]|nr:hypothetical protein [Bacteroidota bacterium]